MNQTLIAVLDSLFELYAEECTKEYANEVMLNWMQGRISGMLFAGMISGTVEFEVQSLLETIANDWFQYARTA